MAYKDPDESRSKSRARWAANRERHSAQRTAAYAADRENKQAENRAYYSTNKERLQARRRELRLTNIEAVRARDRVSNRAKRKANPEKYRVYMRKFKGLPLPTRPAPASCECCGQPPGKKSLALDHCHVSGTFRGWLCGRCNRSIGQLGDSIEGLMNAVRYLQRAAQSEVPHG